MLLPPELFNGLLEALLGAYAEPGEIGTLLLKSWGKPLNDFVGLGPPRPNVYSDLIRAVNGRGLILHFVAIVRADRQDNGQVQAIYRLFQKQTGSATGDPFHACLLEQSMPFWNRTTLRSHVQDLMSRRKRILLVNGAGRSGRSITRWYINHIAQFHHVTPYYVDMKEKAKKQAGPEDIARLIALNFRWPVDEMPQQRAQSSQWAEELAVWLAGWARAQASVAAAPGRVMLVFDNTCAPGLRPETKELLINLADRAAEEDQLRVVLLAHTDPFTSDARHFAVFDDIRRPNKTDLFDFLKAYDAHEGLGFDDAAIETIVSQVVWDPLAKTLEGDVALDELVVGVRAAMTFMDETAAKR